MPRLTPESWRGLSSTPPGYTTGINYTLTDGLPTNADGTSSTTGQSASSLRQSCFTTQPELQTRRQTLGTTASDPEDARKATSISSVPETTSTAHAASDDYLNHTSTPKTYYKRSVWHPGLREEQARSDTSYYRTRTNNYSKHVPEAHRSTSHQTWHNHRTLHLTQTYRNNKLSHRLLDWNHNQHTKLNHNTHHQLANNRQRHDYGSKDKPEKDQLHLTTLQTTTRHSNHLRRQLGTSPH